MTPAYNRPRRCCYIYTVSMGASFRIRLWMLIALSLSSEQSRSDGVRSCEREARSGRFIVRSLLRLVSIISTAVASDLRISVLTVY